MPGRLIYEYADGSANLYSLTGTRLEYIPVRPEESSTGTYSGGDPKTVELTQARADSIRSLLDRASNNTSIQISDRLKGSGLIHISDNKKHKQVILKQGYQEIQDIESLLKECLRD